MDSTYFIAAAILTFIIPMINKRNRFYASMAVSFLIALVTSIPAIRVLADPAMAPSVIRMTWIPGSITCVIDGLSAFFILVTNFTTLTGLLFSKGYLEPYRETKSAAQLALHNFSYIWLQVSMLGVLMLRDGLSFLIAWELMAVSSFMLILFEAEKRATLKTAVNYLVQMHVGLVLLIIAFLLCEASTGEMSFDALTIYFANHRGIWLFLLFFAGFAVKAGFVPFHTWLPEAHPAAPSHVSGLMSGVMIKMGIYGIFRVLTYIQSDLYSIGIILLVFSMITGIFGIMTAIVQKDLKRLLAYSSIENIGIIGMGMGLGTMGLGSGNTALAILGFGGGMLHVLNHSLFKSLLFFTSGSVYKSCHTRNMEELGGVIHKMPRTAGLFLVGSLAICGLPPLNGFISEVLIFLGLFRGLSAGDAYQSVFMIIAIVTLVVIGGLAIFCFTRAFGITFLGSPRTEPKMQWKESDTGMLFPQYIIALFMLVVGLLPLFFLRPITRLLALTYHQVPDAAFASMESSLGAITNISIILFCVIGALMSIRYFAMKKRVIKQGPTWGCGYTAGTAKQQYTGASYASNVGELAGTILQTGNDLRPITEEEIFPDSRTFSTRNADIFSKLLNKLMDGTMWVLKKLARLQTGNIQHYILYAFVFIILIFILLYLNIL